MGESCPIGVRSGGDGARCECYSKEMGRRKIPRQKKAAERAREMKKTGGGMSSVKQRTERLGGEDFGSYRGISGRRSSRRGRHWRPRRIQQLYAASTADTEQVSSQATVTSC